MNVGSKKGSKYNSDRYAYALGVFILSLITDSDPDVLLFDPDVRAIFGSMMAKHAKERRLKTPSFVDGLRIGTLANNATVDAERGTPLTINAAIRLVQMKHAALLSRVYKINETNFELYKMKGAQQLTRDSVRIANRFLEILDHTYDEYMAAKNIGKGGWN